MVLGIVAGSAVVSWICVRGLLPILRGRVMDLPNERSSHVAPTPRGGGVAVVVAVLLVLAWAIMAGRLGEGVGAALFGALTMAFVGLADDFQGGLKVGIRFLIQATISGVVVFILGPLSALPLPPPANLGLTPWVGWAVTLGWVLGVTNIFNFLDGIDGFAGLQGVIAGLALGWILVPGSVASMVALAAAGGSLGFLLHNWQPASVFMGDVGSLFLGFLFAALPLAASPDLVGPAVSVSGIALWFFLADGIFTLMRRAFRGERVWQAHRSHLYQRLVKVGWSHARVTLTVMVPAAFLALAGVVVQSMGFGPLSRWALMVVAILCLGIYVALVRHEEKAEP